MYMNYSLKLKFKMSIMYLACKQNSNNILQIDKHSIVPLVSWFY